MSAVGGDEVRESGGEHVGTVADGAAAPVNELQFLPRSTRYNIPDQKINPKREKPERGMGIYLAAIEGEEAREEEARKINGCHDVKLL